MPTNHEESAVLRPEGNSIAVARMLLIELAMGAQALRETFNESPPSPMPTSVTLCSSQRTALAAGSIIAGKYRLDALVGEGGMGAVWRAHNLQLESQVAIKLLRAGPKSEELGERLRNEARAVAQLAHPSIVRVFDVGETAQGEPFIVMELLTGQGLAQVLARGPLPCVQAVQMLLPIAEALTLAHKKGIVHRDIKPDNVFISNGDEAIQPKLLDFGIAKLTGELSGTRSLTQEGTLLGSPDYMSPEQVYGGADVDHRSDMWSFSVVLYECLTGFVPFKAANNYELFRAIIENEPLPFPEAANIDESLGQIILSGLLKDKHLRPRSMHELGCSLARWLLDRGVVEDVCGASLEARWAVPTASQPSQADALTDESESQSAAPSRRQTARTVMGQASRRRRSWSLLACSLVIGGALAWVSLGLLPMTPEAEAKRLTSTSAGLATRAAVAGARAADEVVKLPVVAVLASALSVVVTSPGTPSVVKAPARNFTPPSVEAPKSAPVRAPSVVESTPRDRPATPSHQGIDLMDPY